MVGVPNALIGDPGEIAKYNAQGPNDPTKYAADQIRSEYAKGNEFAAADRAASKRLTDFVIAADEGIRSFRFQAGASADAYMNNDLFNKAQFQSISEFITYTHQPEQELPKSLPATAPDPEPDPLRNSPGYRAGVTD